MTYQLEIADHKRALLKADQLATSLERAGGTSAEAEIVAKQVDDNADSFEDGPCPSCEWEEGRSEADKRYHEENCS